MEEHMIRNMWWVGNLQTCITKFVKDEQLLATAALAMKRLNQFPSALRTLEVQFEGESGFGQGVTQSFYVEIANKLIERDANQTVPMWVEDEVPSYVQDASQYNHVGQTCRRGLYVRPLPSRQKSVQPGAFAGKPETLNTDVRVLQRFKFLGRIFGKSLREGFICPVPLSEEFFALVQGHGHSTNGHGNGNGVLQSMSGTRRGIRVGSSSLPRPGQGYTGEFVGLMAEYHAYVQKKLANVLTEFDNQHKYTAS